MEKFLSIPVTGEGQHLISCKGVQLIEVGAGAAAPTTTLITYSSGQVVTVTHATVGAASGTNSGTQFRQFLQSEILEALATSWTFVNRKVTPQFAVSDIAVA
tara:strand:+ start:1074 stop:1379 length:306 start_codon:yes stop_codon:yes gene_type:complete